ncbi:hypothetical protein HXA35_05150 [Bacillus sp. A301a_S52]|nr:hypothetical protein [Bacillus sp. A301a_S52]
MRRVIAGAEDPSGVIFPRLAEALPAASECIFDKQPQIKKTWNLKMALT